MREYYNNLSISYLDLDQSPALVEFAQSILGKILLLTLFAYLFMMRFHVHPFGHHPNISLLNWKSVIIYSLTLMTFFPRYRRHLLLLTNLYCFNQLFWLGGIWGAMHQLFLLQYASTSFSWMLLSSLVLISIVSMNSFFYVYHLHQPHLQRKQHPILFLLTVTFILIFIASEIPPGIIKIYLWCFLSFQCSILWFIAYSLKDMRTDFSNNNKTGTPIWQQFSHYFPFWGSSNTPFPKGAAYLNKIEAKSEKELALSQLSGVRLIIWVYVLFLFNAKLSFWVQGYHIPSFPEAIQHCAIGQPFLPSMAWLILIMNFTFQTISLCLKGHVIIATCKMAGFNAKRNTDQPFLASTIAEFWNRYYFYFKEVLVEMFFYPTYFRYFKHSPKVRIVFATFAAAGFGNVLYHIMSKLPYLLSHGFFTTLVDLQSYYFDGLLLSTGISISLLRKRKPSSFKALNWIRRYIMSPIIVIGFFAILSIFSTPFCSNRLLINFLFLKSLFPAWIFHF